MKLGYNFFDLAYDNAPGAMKFEVIIRKTPTEKHYDPEQMMLDVVSVDNLIESLVVYHPWPLESQYRVTAGHVVLTDRKGKKVTAFTFGGHLEIDTQNNATTGKLSSPAPILELHEINQISTMLANEAEILLAERAAAWLPDSLKYQRRLAAVHPWSLYTACLSAIEAKYETLEHQDVDFVHEFRFFVQREISTLEEMYRWPGDVPQLKELV